MKFKIGDIIKYYGNDDKLFQITSTGSDEFSQWKGHQGQYWLEGICLTNYVNKYWDMTLQKPWRFKEEDCELFMNPTEELIKKWVLGK